MNKFNVSFTEEQGKALVIQLSARVDNLTALQERAMQRKDLDRVLQLENTKTPIKEWQDKIYKAMNML